MKQERVVLSFIMVFIGLVVAAGAFFFYQANTKENKDQVAQINVSPTPLIESGFFLNVESPKDESLADRKTIKVSGKTTPDATVVILTTSLHEVVKPSMQGDFSTNITIDDGLNYIKIQAIAPNGEIETVERVVSYTTEDF
ncbi:MAG: hypothetical protein HYT06_01550 [Candidatus Levybacteria bacterium]|nr:hypothetical protein [Candidatus Levybacteria bacterium]